MHMVNQHPELRGLFEFLKDNQEELLEEPNESIFAQKWNLSEYAEVQKVLFPTSYDSPDQRNTIDSEIEYLKSDMAQMDRMIQIKQS